MQRRLRSSIRIGHQQIAQTDCEGIVESTNVAGMAPATLFKSIDNMYAAIPHVAPPPTTTIPHRTKNPRPRSRIQTIKHTFRFDTAPHTSDTHNLPSLPTQPTKRSHPKSPHIRRSPNPSTLTQSNPQKQPPTQPLNAIASLPLHPKILKDSQPCAPSPRYYTAC